MEALYNYNIKIVEGNAFTLVLPLKSRTYTSCKPIDEDIIIADLEDVRVTINGVQYDYTLESDGVHVHEEGLLKPDNYSVVLTAIYHGIEIRAAYKDAITIVSWNNYSNAQQFLQGSPVVLPAAYLLGVMTDEETEGLKSELRERIEEAEIAKAEAEAARDEYIRKAEQLDNVAQQSTLVQGVTLIREDISRIDLDSIAKQGDDPTATNTAIKELIINEGIERANEYAAEIREIIGDWNNE